MEGRDAEIKEGRNEMKERRKNRRERERGEVNRKSKREYNELARMKLMGRREEKVRKGKGRGGKENSVGERDMGKLTENMRKKKK